MSDEIIKDVDVAELPVVEVKEVNDMKSLIENLIRKVQMLELSIIDTVQKLKEQNDGLGQLHDMKSAAKYLMINKGTLYNLVNDGQIKCHKPNGKIYFYQNELVQYVIGKDIKQVYKKKTDK